MKAQLVGVVVTWVLAGSLAAGAAVGPRPAVASPRDDRWPLADAGYLAWTVQRTDGEGSPQFDTYVRSPAGGTRRINPTGSTAASLGMYDGNLVYTIDGGFRVVELRSRATRTLAAPDAALSYTSRVGPLGFLYVKRGPCGEKNLVLYDLATRKERSLDKIVCRLGAILPGDVSGTFAVWARCVESDPCTVHRYDARRHRVDAVPTPRGVSREAAALADDGTVYFAERRGRACGARVSLVRWQGGQPARLATLAARGADVRSLAVSSGPGATTVYYERRSCGEDRSDIYALTLR